MPGLGVLSVGNRRDPLRQILVGLEDGYERRTTEYNIAERVRVYGSTEQRHRALGVNDRDLRRDPATVRDAYDDAWAIEVAGLADPTLPPPDLSLIDTLGEGADPNRPVRIDQPPYESL